MKINSVQHDMTLKQGNLGLSSYSQSLREKNKESMYENTGYSTNYCGSFTGKSETAATAIKKGGILTKNWFNKFLEQTYHHNIATSALVALGLAGVMRPATIMALPGKKDKEDKIYASGHSLASAILGFVASTIITSPLDTGIKKLFEDPEKFGSKKLAKIKRISASLEKRADMRNSAGEIINRKSRELFKAMNKHKGSLETLAKNLPDWIIAIPRSILTIALIPPILKYVFGVEKKKSAPQTPQKDNDNMNLKMDFLEKPVFQKFKGGVK